MTHHDENKQENDKKSEEHNTKSEKVETEDIPKLREGDWMLKPCDAYMLEFKDCKSIGARYYQSFYYGEALNCTQWKIDHENCEKWQRTDDDTAYEDLLASEKKRRLARLKPNISNDVWKRRKAPPSDWNEPLPDWMAERQASTFLASKQKEAVESGKYSEIDSLVPSCSIQ